MSFHDYQRETDLAYEKTERIINEHKRDNAELDKQSFEMRLARLEKQVSEIKERT